MLTLISSRRQTAIWRTECASIAWDPVLAEDADKDERGNFFPLRLSSRFLALVSPSEASSMRESLSPTHRFKAGINRAFRGLFDLAG
eukprot:m.33248 g.33248  ORF g.33248 m.33248 type:complete len:87 (-) comp42858_c0_seq1:447-707(-)